MKLIIRHATVEDAPILAQAEREIAKTPGYFCSQPFELTDEQAQKTVTSSLQTKKGVFFVAEYNGTIVGHAFLEPLQSRSLSHIAELNVAVHLGWQDKGIGTQLIEKLIEWALHSNTIEKIELSVRASNHKAISLYKKLGFREEGRLKNHVKMDDLYFDDLLMALEVQGNHQKNDFSIRMMKGDDVDSLSHTFCFPWTTLQQTLEKWQRYYVEQQAHGRTVCLLEASNQLIGYGSLLRFSQYPYFKDNKIPEINDIWIKEELRNRGFGKALITHLENRAREEGYEKIGIGVGLYRDYGPAQKLYVEMGYVPDGRGVTYKYVYINPGEPYPVDDDLITWMQKAL